MINKSNFEKFIGNLMRNLDRLMYIIRVKGSLNFLKLIHVHT